MLKCDAILWKISQMTIKSAKHMQALFKLHKNADFILLSFNIMFINNLVL